MNTFKPKTEPAYKYIIPVNSPEEGGSVTLDVVQIVGSPAARCSLLRRFFKHKYLMTRKQANTAIVALGFDDLIPCTS